MQRSRLETVPCAYSPGAEDDAEASDAFLSCASLTATRRRMPSQPSKSDFVLSTYSSIPPHYTSDNIDICVVRWIADNGSERRTLRMVLRARVESFTRTISPRASEKRRLRWMLGSHERRVFFFENGTLFPYCFVFPWNRPSCDRLKGWLSAAARDGKEGNMVVRRPGFA